MGGSFAEQVGTTAAIFPKVASAGTFLSDFSVGFAHSQCRSLIFVSVAGAATGTPTTTSILVTLESTTEDAVWTALPGGPHVTLGAQSGGGLDLPWDMLGNTQYIRARFVVSFTGGTTPTVPIAAYWVYGDPVNSPL